MSEEFEILKAEFLERCAALLREQHLPAQIGDSSGSDMSADREEFRLDEEIVPRCATGLDQPPDECHDDPPRNEVSDRAQK